MFVDNTRLPHKICRPSVGCDAKNVFGFCVFLRRHSKSEEVALSSLSRLYILANLLWNKRSSFVICDLWISIRFVCFCASRLDALFLKSTVSFALALRFFNFFTLKHGKFRFQRWNCSYRASKSRGNTATEGWKRTGTFPLTFTFADKHSGCYGNGLIEFGACSIWIVKDVGRGSFLFPTYLGTSKETLLAGYLICFTVTLWWRLV